jgi:hypothetical protein
MHGFFDAVLIIGLILAVGYLRSARNGGGGLGERLAFRGRRDGPDQLDGRETALEAEIVELRKRIAVLERIATDERKSREIAAEIEKLRD